MEHISFWSTLKMLIYWTKKYIRRINRQ